MSFIIVPLMMLFGLIGFFFIDKDIAIFPERLFLFGFYFLFTVYFLKDSFRGKSPGKRIIGFQVIDRKTNLPANSVKCFVRNLFTPLWPLEIFITIISPNRRLGDVMANTKVVEVETESLKLFLKDFKNLRFSRNTLIIVIIAIVYSFLLFKLMMMWHEHLYQINS